MVLQIRLTKTFTDKMYKNMWQFINQEMIKDMFNRDLIRRDVKFSAKTDIDDDDFSMKKFRNTICYKGDIDDGHWVYVDASGIGHSTYEDNLIKGTDDGVCHGVALINALGLNKKSEFLLISSPKTEHQYKINYKNILRFYLYLIKSGRWDKALVKNFYYDMKHTVYNYGSGSVSTTKSTIKSYKLLNSYITRFTN